MFSLKYYVRFKCWNDTTVTRTLLQTSFIVFEAFSKLFKEFFFHDYGWGFFQKTKLLLQSVCLCTLKKYIFLHLMICYNLTYLKRFLRNINKTFGKCYVWNWFLWLKVIATCKKKITVSYCLRYFTITKKTKINVDANCLVAKQVRVIGFWI